MTPQRMENGEAQFAKQIHRAGDSGGHDSSMPPTHLNADARCALSLRGCGYFNPSTRYRSESLLR